MNQELLGIIVQHDLEKDDLKATDFRVNMVYQSYQDKNDNYQKFWRV